MIRVRKADGSAVEIQETGTFVELVNDMDQTVMLSLLQLQPGVLLQIRPGTVDAQRYESMFKAQGVKFSEKMIVRGS